MIVFFFRLMLFQREVKHQKLLFFLFTRNWWMFQVQLIFVLSNKCIYLLLWDKKEKNYLSQMVIINFSFSDPLPILEQSVIQQQKVSKLQVKFFSTTAHVDSFENRARTHRINLVQFASIQII